MNIEHLLETADILNIAKQNGTRTLSSSDLNKDSSQGTIKRDVPMEQRRHTNLNLGMEMILKSDNHIHVRPES